MSSVFIHETQTTWRTCQNKLKESRLEVGRPGLRSQLSLATHTRLAWTALGLVDGEFYHLKNGDNNTNFGELHLKWDNWHKFFYKMLNNDEN